MMKREMHVEFLCHLCGKKETLIFLEPVDVNQIRDHVVPPDWEMSDCGLVCKECQEVRGKWLN